ncbi:hypothetical protein FOQG_01681 [Fusarium oxysporum f. sp. raphani 54005]|uniref:Uncharacterized protein n=4 Tax=Fusarium oxysporum TaxID=5507 RepID=X0DXT0_FUSOX|nr:hypothetical protein FOVG_09527 [Fusarium oxysporum f. sp. pisi HDV247]EXK98982.1 hypothetical protein FOQG_01681 [Fusarium oxysporum f. sp. raphani 54005]EXL87873.1 hypothetical protein FOPG_00950 [Fusarium oxysporum f. sp. conglutinans race 2 54008]EXM34842.1 hypothetical protein FOTG_01518 [Fusarium oxysporum f. sp. vasinfectum 25433]
MQYRYGMAARLWHNGVNGDLHEHSVSIFNVHRSDNY